MTMPWTLQRYIFREMGKTFGMTAIAMVTVIGLGGGVMNMIKLGDMTPAQLLRLMALILPVAAALTLPFAALFSAAATYGRISADNEFVACRSSGINLHVLFLPAVVLSLGSAAVTFGFINFIIPGMVQNLNEFVSADIGSLIQSRLARPKGITLGGQFRIHADENAVNVEDGNHIVLYRVAFVEVEEGEWVRFGTAKQVDLVFEKKDNRLTSSGWLTGLSYYDRKAGHFFEEAQQVFPPNELPSLVPRQIKFLGLRELLYYWVNPQRWHEVVEKVDRLRLAVGKSLVYDELWQQWQENQFLRLQDDDRTITVRAEVGGRVPRVGGIELGEVTITETRAGRTRSLVAKRAVLDIPRAGSLGETGVLISAYDVRVTDGEQVFDRTKESLGPVAVSDEMIARVQGLSTRSLVEAAAADPANAAMNKRRDDALDARSRAVREIAATFHQRSAFSISVVTLVLLAAGLGIALRGAHTVIAFGISFVPALLVIVAIVMGKQMAQNATTHLLGIAVIWSGIAATAGLDLWVLGRVVRR